MDTLKESNGNKYLRQVHTDEGKAYFEEVLRTTEQNQKSLNQ